MTTTNRIRASIENIQSIKREETHQTVATNLILALIHLERAAQENERLKKP